MVTITSQEIYAINSDDDMHTRAYPADELAGAGAVPGKKRCRRRRGRTAGTRSAADGGDEESEEKRRQLSRAMAAGSQDPSSRTRGHSRAAGPSSVVSESVE